MMFSAIDDLCSHRKKKRYREPSEKDQRDCGCGAEKEPDDQELGTGIILRSRRCDDTLRYTLDGRAVLFVVDRSRP